MHNIFSLKDLLTGDSTFIYTSEKKYSYSDTLLLTASYRKYFSDQKIPSSYAAVKSTNSAEMIAALFSLWSLGITPLLLNARLTESETDNILAASGCEYLINDDIIKSVSFKHNDTNDYEINIDDTAVVIFTSGSTGKPKGVELTFRTLRDAAVIQSKYLDQRIGDKWLASLPFYHIGGLSVITRALFNQGVLIIPGSLKSEDLVNAIEEFHPDYISLVGAQLRKILDSGYTPAGNLKNVLIGGGFTEDKLILEALDKGWPVSKVYGSTETAAFVSVAGGESLRKYPASAGKELVEGSIFILDKKRQQLTYGNEGEVAVKNIPLMKGYLKDKKRTRERYSSGFFLTKDIGYINEEGFLFLVMRREDLIISGGENLNPKEIENALLEIDEVTDVYVFAIADEKWGQIAAAAVSSSKKISEEEIKKYLKVKLADFKVPKQFFFVEYIPRNELGKIDLSRFNQTINAQKVS